MAEEERQWLQRHTHESNIVSYGIVGRATYDQQEKTWSFSRELDTPIEIDDFDETITHSLLRLLSDEAEVVLEKSRIASEGAVKLQDISKLARRIPELAPGSETVRGIAKLEASRTSSAPIGHLFDFGGAVWLQDINTYDPGHLSIPIIASVVGEGANTLRLASITHKGLDYNTSVFLDHANSVNITPKIFIPSLASESASTWSSTEPILQVLFSNRHHGGHSNTFLAVRQASQTIIFQPLRSGALTASGHELIQPHQLISIGLAATGGHSHADVAFHPYSRRRIAIIDVEGNWSVWHTQGRRSRTARILYHAHLSLSGKIFSWTYKKRPEGVGLHYDGWHRLLWLSSTDSEIDRLLVCNRQTMKLFDLKGNEVCSIDARLNRTKAFSHIVDMKKCATSGMFFILTTTQLLLFDITQKEWRDIGRTKGPGLLCAWYHYYNHTDLSLNMSTVENGDEVLVALHSSRIPRLRTYQMKIVKVNGKHTVVSSSPTSTELPMTNRSKIIRVVLASVEAKPRQRGLDVKLPQFIQVVTQHEDLAVGSILGILQSPESISASDYQHEPRIKLPPQRESRFKSDHRVDAVDDEDNQDDLVGFVVPDSPAPFEVDSILPLILELGDKSSRTITFSKHMAGVANHLISLQHTAAPSSKPSISKAFADLYEALQGYQSSEDNLVSRTISELCTEMPRLDDVEDDSVVLAEAIGDLARQMSDNIVISNVGATLTPSLAQIYEELFNRNVSALPPSMPNRARIQREWIVREIALDLQLSSHYIRRQAHEADRSDHSNAAAEAPPLLANLDILSSDAVIFSDPLQDMETESNRLRVPNLAHISASQPQPQVPTTTSERRTTSSPSPPVPSHLQNAISRLSALTTIPPLAALSIPESAEEHITDILTHLPQSLDLVSGTDAAIDPTNYDWAAAELISASSRAPPDQSTLSNASDPKAKRKAERLAKARRRADDIRREVERDQQRRSVVPTIISSQLQPPFSASATVRDRDRDREVATLVYRTSPAKPQPQARARLDFDLPTLPASTPVYPSTSSASGLIHSAADRQRERERWSQPQPSHLGQSALLSDPVAGGLGSSSQAVQERGGDVMPSTQPERGVFGTRMSGGRVGIVNGRDQQQQQQRKKKKKVVMPGFG